MIGLEVAVGEGRRLLREPLMQLLSAIKDLADPRPDLRQQDLDMLAGAGNRLDLGGETVRRQYRTGGNRGLVQHLKCPPGLFQVGGYRRDGPPKLAGERRPDDPRIE